MAFPVTLNGRTYTLADFSGTNYVEGFPDALEDFVTQAGDLYNSTSTTSNTIGTGSKTFAVDSGKPYQAGTPLRIADAAAPATNFLDVIVTSYSGTSLVVDVFGFAGSGTYTSWTVNIGGAKTADGTLPVAQGGTGATTAADARTNLDTYSKGEADSRFLNVSGEASNVVMNGNVTIGDAGTDTLTVNATATLADATLTTADINGGTIDGVTIGGASAGAVTTTSLVATTADINGGTIDGTVIGGSTPAAISGTTGQFGTSLNVDGTVTADGLTVDGVEVINTGSTTAYSAGMFTGALIFTPQSYDGLAIQASTDGFSSLYMESAGLTGYLGERSARITVSPTPAASYGTDIIFNNRRINAAMSQALKIDGNGDISFYEDTGTTPKFFWDASAESLGIGTSSPAQKLHIENTSAGAYAQITSGTSSVAGVLLGDTLNNSIGRVSYDNADNSLQLWTSGAERLRITSTGNVGIGTSSPTFALDVVNSGLGIIRIKGGTGTNEGGSFFVQYAGSTSALGAFGDRARFFGGTPDQLMSVSSAVPLTFDIGGTERARIDTSGNVGLGVTPSAWNGAYKAVQLPTGSIVSPNNGSLGIGANIYTDGAATNRYVANGFSTYHDQTNGQYRWFNAPSGTAGNPITFSQAMTLDASGNLLVGKTSPDVATVGAELRADGVITGTVNGGAVAFFNRTTSDGAIVSFRKDNTTVGSIGTAGGDIYVGTGDTNLFFDDGNDAIWPATTGGATRDNAIDLGFSSIRFDDVYATNGTIQTSDRNEKQDIEALSDAEQRVAVACKGLLRKFRWKDAVEEKGEDARIHFGIIAQDLQAAFEAEGLDAGRYAMFIHSTWTDEETGEERSRMGVRYPQLLAFIIAAI
jgi:hypothetical protein